MMLLERMDLFLKQKRVRLVALALLGVAVISTTALLLETRYPSKRPKVRYYWRRHSIPSGKLIRGFVFWKTYTNGPVVSRACAVRIGNSAWELEQTTDY